MDRKLAKPRFLRFRSPIRFPDHSLREVMRKFDDAEETLTSIIKEDQNHEEDTTDGINPSLPVEADLTSSNPNSGMVGFDDDALHLKDRLTSQRREREIIPIVGMGGIGKTFLARHLYNDPLIVSHFDDNRAWATISQNYSVRAILLGLLGSIFGMISDDMLKENDDELGLTLYKRLYGKRYLVVLDDIWSKKAWDEIRRYFPTENHRSRILITSRELDGAKHPDSSCEEHQMHLLSSAQGWELLRQKVFDAEKEESCPPFLEEIGQTIVRDCRGLPLAISVIGGLLSTDKYSKDLWEQVAEDVRSVLSHRDEDFSKILCLSYDNLPPHLKPCFLYMAAFSEDFAVRSSKLVKLWAAEGFLWRPSGNNESLEYVAEEYLKALVDRNLLQVACTKSNGGSESYSMHDLLRDLCVRKADDDKFLCVFKNGKVSSFRRVSTHRQEDEPDLAEDLSLSRSLYIGPGYSYRETPPALFTLRLVRVLDVHDLDLYQFPTEILNLVNLRFLAVKFLGSVPSRIWRLRNLQTLIIKSSEYHLTIPSEAWKMISDLRHIKVRIASICIGAKIIQVHENLQTIFCVSLRDLLASNLVNCMPNIRKLGIDGRNFDFQGRIVDLSHLRKLETLRFEDFGVDVLSRIKLPSHLKKVSLFFCKIPMRFFNVVGALPNVDVLKIKHCTFESEERSEEEEEEEWELNEGVEFSSLQFLELFGLRKLVRWKADDAESHFPRLRYLRLRRCDELKIPKSIEDDASNDRGGSLESFSCELGTKVSGHSAMRIRERNPASFYQPGKSLIDDLVVSIFLLIPSCHICWGVLITTLGQI